MKKVFFHASLFFFYLLPWTSYLPAQTASGASNTALSVEGAVTRPLKLSPADFAKLPRHTVKVKDMDGKEITFEGAALVDILTQAGVKFGEDLRGARLTEYLLVTAADGYQIVIALPEIDPAFTDRTIIVADHRDGKPLTEKEAPYRIVIPEEKRAARWIRQVTTLTIRNAKDSK